MCRRRPLVATVAFAAASFLVLSGCSNEASTEPGDSPGDGGTPSALGSGLRIVEMNTPDSALMPANNQLNVAVTGATFLVQDTYAETGLASSVGNVYAEDFHAPDAGGLPYSGIELYKTTFEPASLSLSPGDVIDFTGEYQSSYCPAPGECFYGPEMYEPIVTFRFDYSPPTPTVISISDLKTPALGDGWLSMLVRVEDTEGGGFSVGSKVGQCWVFLTADHGEDTGVAMDNELYDIDCASPVYNPPNGGSVHFLSVTGIVTNDGNFRIAPRSADDIRIASD